MFPFSSEDLKQPVEVSINRVRPMLLRDGGDINVIDIKENVIYVRLLGACKGCSSSSLTLKYGVQKALREDIHPDIVVVEV